jgi:hypothetical protein
LAATFHGSIQLDAGSPIANRDHVFRFTLVDGPVTAPASVIVKRAREWGGVYDPDTTDPWNPAWALLSDWAGLQLLSTVAGDLGLAPHFYAGDQQHGLLVIEDLGSGDRPDQLLLGNNPESAAATLIELATLLGAMHARTIEHQATFDRICATIGRRPTTERDLTATLGVALHATLDVLGITPPTALDTDLTRLITAIQQPGPFLAYTHGDPCPDNWLRAAGTLRLLDFERGTFRHALLDGVYGRILFPTCWCVNRLPSHLPGAMQAAYRTALAAGCPTATDDRRFGHAVVEACAYWAIEMCEWIVERPAWYAPPRLLTRDQQWGIATLQQRALVRADVLVDTVAEYRHLEAIGTTFALIAAKLRSLWPSAADAMPAPQRRW